MLFQSLVICVFLKQGLSSPLSSDDRVSSGFECDDGHMIPREWKCNGYEDCLSAEDEKDCPLEADTTESISGKRTQIFPILQFTAGENGNCVLSFSKVDGFICDVQRCVPNSFKCNGVINCEDGSDEKNCAVETLTNDVTTTESSSKEVKTTNAVTTIESLPEEVVTTETALKTSDSVKPPHPLMQRCTLPEDWGWESREGIKCGDSPYGSCIPAAWRCDGDRDCYDGSDELNCEVETTTNTVETTHRTSGEVTPGSEPNLPGRDLSADEETTPAPDDDKRCTLSPYWSIDGTDEGFQCGDGICIPVSYRCDGDRDCRDGSDELNCPVETVTEMITSSTSSTDEVTPPDSNEHCTLPENRFTFWKSREGIKCGDSPYGSCIPAAWRCDGDRDCYDGSDELNCEVETTTNTVETTHRTSGEVTPGSEPNLPGNDSSADEETTPAPDDDRRCLLSPVWHVDGRDEGHRCGNNRCIPVSFRCDGEWDCMDGSDELNCPRAVETVTQTITTSTSSPDEVTPPDSNNVFSFFGTDKNLIKKGNEAISGIKDFASLPMTVNVEVQNMKNYFGTIHNKNGENSEAEEVKEKKKRFELETTEVSWVEAQAICKSKGGELASITSEDENSQAVLTLKSYGEDRLSEAWIGGLCLDKEKACYWTDSWKQFGFKSWVAGEPNHLYHDQAHEMCVQFQQKDNVWRWNDHFCIKELPFLCQY